MWGSTLSKILTFLWQVHYREVDTGVWCRTTVRLDVCWRRLLLICVFSVGTNLCLLCMSDSALSFLPMHWVVTYSLSDRIICWLPNVLNTVGMILDFVRLKSRIDVDTLTRWRSRYTPLPAQNRLSSFGCCNPWLKLWCLFRKNSLSVWTLCSCTHKVDVLHALMPFWLRWHPAHG